MILSWLSKESIVTTLNVIYKQAFGQYEKENVLSNFGDKDLLCGCDNFRQKIESILTNLACKDFSFAVNAITGWDVIEYGVEGDTTNPWYHSVCKVPDSDLFIDVKGIRTEGQILSDFAEPKSGESLYAVVVDAEPSYLCNTKPLELLASFLIGRDSHRVASNT